MDSSLRAALGLLGTTAWVWCAAAIVATPASRGAHDAGVDDRERAGDSGETSDGEREGGGAVVATWAVWGGACDRMGDGGALTGTGATSRGDGAFRVEGDGDGAPPVATEGRITLAAASASGVACDAARGVTARLCGDSCWGSSVRPVAPTIWVPGPGGEPWGCSALCSTASSRV